LIGRIFCGKPASTFPENAPGLRGSMLRVEGLTKIFENATDQIVGGIRANALKDAR